jgi:hypothetical protein
MATTTAIEMRPMKISEDRKGFYALMPSQSGGKPHKVHFFEPAKGMPCNFSCDCRGYQLRLKCAHCTFLHAYFAEIYDRNDKLSDAFNAAAPVVETTPTPVVETKEQLAEEIDRLLLELEAECDTIVAEIEAEMPTASPQVAPSQPNVVSSVEEVKVMTVQEGRFTVVLDEKQHTFLVERQDADASFAPNQLVISHLVGPDNERSYQGFGFVGEDGSIRIWRKARVSSATIDAAKFLLQGDMPAAGKAYALASGNCWRCGRLLTDSTSINAGIGPTCAAKVGIDRAKAA